MSKQPVMIIVAGPSGGGKSSIFPVEGFPGARSFNVDNRCAELNQGSFHGISPQIRAKAGAECEAFIAKCLRKGHSFVTETTLRTTIAIQQAEKAKHAGFLTRLIYIATEDVEENIRRIQARSAMEGHSAPPDVIREIYKASLDNLLMALQRFDRSDCYDNSGHIQAATQVAVCNNRVLALTTNPTPRWLARLLPNPSALTVPVEDLRLPPAD